MKYILFKPWSSENITIWKINSLEDNSWEVMVGEKSLPIIKFCDININDIIKFWKERGDKAYIYNSMEELAAEHFVDLL